MELFDKLLGGFKKKQETQNNSKEQTQSKQEAQVSQELINEYQEKLVSIVYDEDVAKELAPVFAKLSLVEGFDSVYELLETKEKQIEVVSNSDWLKKSVNEEDGEEETVIDTKQEDDSTNKVMTADEILSQQFNQ